MAMGKLSRLPASPRGRKHGKQAGWSPNPARAWHNRARGPSTSPACHCLSLGLHSRHWELQALGHVTLAMLLPPLARAASRPGLRAPSVSWRPTRVFTSSPLHRKDVHGQRPPSGPQAALKDTQAAKHVQGAATKAKLAKADPLLQEQTLTSKEQRKADWAIMKEMSQYLWPKNNLGTRLRVGLSVGLLVSAKLLNVQVPFYFKSIVDSMNIDFAAVGGTASTVAGSMIVACKLCPQYPYLEPL